VHLATWSFPVTWRKYDGHTIPSAISKNPTLHATRKLHGSMFYSTGVVADRSFYIAGIGICDFFVPMTLTFTRWPSYTNLTVVSCLEIPNERKWTSYVKAFEVIVLHTYRHADIRTYTHRPTYANNIIPRQGNYIPRRFVGGQKYTAECKCPTCIVNKDRKYNIKSMQLSLVNSIYLKKWNNLCTCKTNLF